MKVLGLIHKKMQVLSRYISAYCQGKHKALAISCTCTKNSYPGSEKDTKHSVDKFSLFLKCSCYFYIKLVNLLFMYSNMPYSSHAHKFDINPFYSPLAFFRSKGFFFFFF